MNHLLTQQWRSKRLRAMRAFDVAVASILLSLTWPILLLAAIAVWFDSKGQGSIIFRQTRLGKGGRPFTMYKLRTMQADAEADGIPRCTTPDDPRVTAVGRHLRRLRIDELPQLINVLKGEMSVVGPRPERPEFAASLRKWLPNYTQRHCLPPGITGWAQVRLPYAVSLTENKAKLQYDLEYLQRKSISFDTYILLQTLPVVLLGRGAR